MPPVRKIAIVNVIINWRKNMKKILIIIFTIAIFVTGGIFGYKKIVSDEREKKIIQMFNKDVLNSFVENQKSLNHNYLKIYWQFSNLFL